MMSGIAEPGFEKKDDMGIEIRAQNQIPAPI